MASIDPGPVQPLLSTDGGHTHTSYAVQIDDRVPFVIGDGTLAFEMRVPSDTYWRKLVTLDPYRAALEYIEGRFDVDGDLTAAVSVWLAQPRTWSVGQLLRFVLPRLRFERWFQTRTRAARNVAFHYDRSNDFFAAFLDRRMVYSCAYFREPTISIDDAQEAKLHHVCRKLDLTREDTVLDIGCGWGALVVHAAERFGVTAVGCTLSHAQREAADRTLTSRGLTDRAQVQEIDYRDLWGRFSKIASVGMVEHVGRSRLLRYFTKLNELLEPSGLLLNHGIARPETLREGAATHFLQRHVFPGAELPTLAQVIVAAERAGFEVLDVENLRPHYALTCRAWVQRLRANKARCLAAVDEVTYRTWLLYLAGSAVQFADGLTDVHQLLLAKRSSTQVRHLTRDYVYGTESSHVA